MRIILLLVSIGLSTLAWGQPNRGIPYIVNYSTVEYRQGTQNFAVIQDKSGILYFGNSNGVLEFDGINWRLIKVTNQSEVHALAVDETNGRIYVGAQGEFGFLQPDAETGKLAYVSLLPLVAPPHRNFHDVWSINVAEEQVIIRATAGIYLYQHDTILSIPLASNRHRSFYVQGDYFLWLESKGLLQLQGDSLVSAPLGHAFMDTSIHCMLPYSATDLLMVTREEGCFLYDGQSVRPFKTEIDSLIKGQNMFGELLPNGNYAITTRSEGLLIMDKKGRLVQKIDEETGLMGSSVWDVYPDRYSDDLWLALNNGISMVETRSPFTSFGKEDGVLGQFYHLKKFKDKLYAAGSIGVYAKEWLETPQPILTQGKDFKLVKNGQAHAWHFYADEDELLVASNSGILRLNEQTAALEDIGFKDRAWYILPLKNYPDYIVANTIKGLILLKKENKRWQVVRKLDVPQESFYYFAQDEWGNIWADIPTKGVFLMRFDKGITAEPTYTLLTKEDGLPSSFKVRPFDLGNEVVFATTRGVYTYQPSTKSFVPHPIWNSVLDELKHTAIEWMELDAEGNLWFVCNQESEQGVSSLVGYAQKTTAGYQLHYDVFKKIEDAKVRDFLVVDEKNVFMGTSEGIIHFNPEKVKQISYSTLLRKVEVMGVDSTLFYGVFIDEEGKQVDYQPASQGLTLPYERNSLRFKVASQDTKNPSSNLYSFYLEGLDEGWSAWTKANSKEYTNLPEGKYRLHVRSKNQYNQLSNELHYSFKILPPWYRTYWAYLLYGLLFAALILLVMRLYGKRLKNQNNWLEQLINERTLEISKQNQDIRKKNSELEKARRIIGEQYETLQDVNFKLEEKVKERTEQLEKAYDDLLVLKNELDTFIYKSSHDINGPMMRLRGLCQLATLDVTDSTGLQYIGLLQDEAEKSIAVLHKLLTFYHIKNAEPAPEDINCSDLLDIVLKPLERLRSSAGMEVCTKDETSTGVIRSDPQMLKIILSQLLENAMVYRRDTAPMLRIRVRCIPTQHLEIRIADNGIGIPTQVSDKIFDMFYRASDKSSGPGLGLYTARTAAAKLQGTIHYTKLKQWSVFTVRLPTLVASHQDQTVSVTQVQN